MRWTPHYPELVGYFMGDGSLHAKGIRLCVADADADVVERIRVLSKGLFALDPVVRPQPGYQEVTLQSIRLARWWKAAGFAKDLPGVDHSGKGWTPRCPRRSARPTTRPSMPHSCGVCSKPTEPLSVACPMCQPRRRHSPRHSRALLATRHPHDDPAHGQRLGRPAAPGAGPEPDPRPWIRRRVGFLGGHKQALADTAASDAFRQPRPDPAAGRGVAGAGARGHELRSLIQQAVVRGRGVSRDLALQLQQVVADPRLAHALGYVFEPVAANVDGGVQPTYDLSVPSNVTYVAAGFVSHNTIGLMMDCDTTGVEPDLALVKFKKLVGGGSMQIVNQTVPEALKSLGYQPESIEAIVEYIAEHGHVVDAPGLRREHYSVFDCAMGERSIAPMGHVRMMAAVQPFISGAISKTVNMPEQATVEDVAEIYQQGWKMGLKALAIYRDNCKVGQPLSASNKNHGEKSADASVVDTPAPAAPATPVVHRSGPPAVAEEAPVADGVVHRGRRRGLPDHRVLPGRRARRGVHQARQAGLHAGRCDGRVLHRGVGRPAVRHPAGVLRRQVHQPAVRAGRHDRRPGRADRHLGDGLPVPPDRAGLPAGGGPGRAGHLLRGGTAGRRSRQLRRRQRRAGRDRRRRAGGEPADHGRRHPGDPAGGGKRFGGTGSGRCPGYGAAPGRPPNCWSW